MILVLKIVLSSRDRIEEAVDGMQTHWVVATRRFPAVSVAPTSIRIHKAMDRVA